MTVIEFDKNFFRNQRAQSNRKVLVTPKLAKHWLDKRNNQNRPISTQHVTALARQMTAGLWTLISQGIGFDWDGQMTDGQHRLSAIAESGVSVEMYVATGEDPGNRLKVDGGRKRSLSDCFVMFADYSSPKVASSAFSSIRRYGFNSREPLSSTEALSQVKRFHAGIDWICRSVGKGDWERGPIVGALALAYLSAPEQITKANDELKSGAIGSPNDPILLYRNNYKGKKLRGDNDSNDAFGHLITALYHRIHGRKSLQLKHSEQALTFFKERI